MRNRSGVRAYQLAYIIFVVRSRTLARVLAYASNQYDETSQYRGFHSDLLTRSSRRTSATLRRLIHPNAAGLRGAPAKAMPVLY